MKTNFSINSSRSKSLSSLRSNSTSIIKVRKETPPPSIRSSRSMKPQNNYDSNEKIREKSAINRILFQSSKIFNKNNVQFWNQANATTSKPDISSNRIESLEKVSKKCLELKSDHSRIRLLKGAKNIKEKFDKLKDQVVKLQNIDEDDLEDVWKAKVTTEYIERKTNINELKTQLKLIYKRKSKNILSSTQRV